MVYDQLAVTLDSYFRINERCVYFFGCEILSPFDDIPSSHWYFFVPVNLSDLTKTISSISLLKVNLWLSRFGTIKTEEKRVGLKLVKSSKYKGLPQNKFNRSGLDNLLGLKSVFPSITFFLHWIQHCQPQKHANLF